MYVSAKSSDMYHIKDTKYRIMRGAKLKQYKQNFRML